MGQAILFPHGTCVLRGGDGLRGVNTTTRLDKQKEGYSLEPHPTLCIQILPHHQGQGIRIILLLFHHEYDRVAFIPLSLSLSVSVTPTRLPTPGFPGSSGFLPQNASFRMWTNMQHPQLVPQRGMLCIGTVWTSSCATLIPMALNYHTCRKTSSN